VVGSAYGAMLATYRGHVVSFYSVSMGANFMICAAAIQYAEAGASSLLGQSNSLSYGVRAMKLLSAVFSQTYVFFFSDDLIDDRLAGQ
jgi:hypothetical protein